MGTDGDGVVSLDELAHRYRSGEAVAAIAAAIGLHPSTVYIRLRRAGLTRRPSAEPPDGLSDDSRRLLGLDGPLPEIQRITLEAAARLAARGAAITGQTVADELGGDGPGTGYSKVMRAIRVLRSLGRWPYDRLDSTSGR